MNITQTLEERGKRYGSFVAHAEITQDIKSAMSESRNWENLDPDQKEALEMIAHKIGRIVNGDPNYADSWHDIAGYARLVEERLVKEGNGAGQKPCVELRNGDFEYLTNPNGEDT